MKNVIIFGPPGSGKGTYSKMIVEKFGMHHISTGDLLRIEIAKQTELGVLASSYLSQGKLLPDSVIIDMLANVYDAQPAGRGIIFDGFPRNIAQAEALEAMLAKRGDTLGIMIELVVGDDVLVPRLLNRAIEEGRSDDNEKTIRARFDVYQQQTQPVAQWFEAKGMRNTIAWSDHPSKEEMIEAIYQLIAENN